MNLLGLCWGMGTAEELDGHGKVIRKLRLLESSNRDVRSGSFWLLGFGLGLLFLRFFFLGSGGFGGLFLARFVGVGAIVGFVESGAFEDDARTGAEEPLDRAIAVVFGADRQLGVIHALKDLKDLIALVAFVVVVRHGLVT